jgi:hypothetical protein
MDTQHCSNLTADRALGQYWEKQFCNLAVRYGKSFQPQQIGRDGAAVAFSPNNGQCHPFTLPDVVIWTCPGEHHEIKHKYPTPNRKFGLEVYRFKALLWFANETGQQVFYTIHNSELAGGRNLRVNKPEHWFTANVLDLNERWSYCTDRHPSYINGQRVDNVPQYFWSADLWQPLVKLWEVPKMEIPEGTVQKAIQKSFWPFVVPID